MFVVVLLGLLIVAGLVAVIGRVLYLSSRSPHNLRPPAAGAMRRKVERAIAEVPLPLPPGAVGENRRRFSATAWPCITRVRKGPPSSSSISRAKAIVARVQIGRDYLAR